MDPPRDVILLSSREDTREMEELLRALGTNLRERVVQNRSRPDPDTFLGTGKLKELRRRLSAEDPTPLVSPATPLVVVDAALKPPQLFGIEDVLRLEVWDRTRVILEIFQTKAQVKEARLQVELARLRYELPFVHEALHRTLTGEHPGFMGGGELPMRTYETHLKRRTKRILSELATVRQERSQRRQGRRKGGFHLVAIAGYTNSGKSSLLNALCGSDADVENRYFSTLQTTTRRLKPEYAPAPQSSLLFTDTVGFIRDLPPFLVDAFASTLEEITSSDIVLLTIDASEPTDLIQTKLHTAWSLLDQLNATKRRVLLLNKSDLVPLPSRSDILNTLSLHAQFPTATILWTSSQTSEGLHELARQLHDELIPHSRLRIEIEALEPHHLGLASWIRDHLRILREETKGTRTTLEVQCTPEQAVQLRRRAAQARVPLREMASTGKEGGSPRRAGKT